MELISVVYVNSVPVFPFILPLMSPYSVSKSFGPQYVDVKTAVHKLLTCVTSPHSICSLVIMPHVSPTYTLMSDLRVRLKCDGTRSETRFRLLSKWASPFKSAGVSVQSTTGS